MSMIQTLLNFLSLESRPKDFPKTEVDGKVSRTLAILNGKSNGGLRTVQVGPEGGIHTRKFDLRDVVAEAPLVLESTGIHGFAKPQIHAVSYCGWLKDPGDIVFVFSWDGAGVNMNYEPLVSAAYYDGSNEYVWVSGLVWVTCNQMRILTSASALKVQCFGYVLPER